MFNPISAAHAYSAARQATAPSALPQGGAIDRMGRAADDFARTMSQVDQTAQGAMTGQVPTHQLVQTIAEAELAMETVVAIRDKVVEAYQEILRMPV